MRRAYAKATLERRWDPVGAFRKPTVAHSQVDRPGLGFERERCKDFLAASFLVRVSERQARVCNGAKGSFHGW